MQPVAAPARFVLPSPDLVRGPQSEAAHAMQATGDGTVASLYRRAYWLRRQGDVRQAGHLLTALLLMRPDEAVFWAAMGECCAAVQDHESAVLALSRAAMLRPDHGPTGLNLVRSLLALGRDDLARPLIPVLVAQAQACADTLTAARLTRLTPPLEQAHAS